MFDRPPAPPPLSGLEADLAEAVVGSKARAVESISGQLAAFIELADAAFNKLGLPQRSQVYVQVSGGAWTDRQLWSHT